LDFSSYLCYPIQIPIPIQLGVNVVTLMNTSTDSQNVDIEGWAVIESRELSLLWVISNGETRLKFYEEGRELLNVKIGMLNDVFDVRDVCMLVEVVGKLRYC
jgi:hypothetical protein